MRRRYMSWVALGGVFIAACVAFATHGASARLVARNRTQGQHTDAQAAATGSYRPDESQIAAVRVGTGNPPSGGVVLMDPTGRQRHILVHATGWGGVGVAVARLAWSPDGHWLVFTGVVGRQANRVKESTTDLFVVRADGSGLRRLTRTGSASEPVWSPDGRTIVFTELTHSLGDPNIVTGVAAQLMRVNRDGTGMRELTPLIRGQVDSPGSFSPDGAHLVFTRFNVSALAYSGHIETSIEAMRADGSGLRQLVAGGGEPAYSPDGRRIAFVSNRDRDGTIRTGEDESEYANELYLMNADGTGAQRLTHSSRLSELAPTWSPDGTRIAYARQAEGFTKTIAVINANGSCGHEIAGDPTGRVWYTEPSWRPRRPRVPDEVVRCSSAGG